MPLFFSFYILVERSVRWGQVGRGADGMDAHQTSRLDDATARRAHGHCIGSRWHESRASGHAVPRHSCEAAEARRDVGATSHDASTWQKHQREDMNDLGGGVRGEEKGGLAPRGRRAPARTLTAAAFESSARGEDDVGGGDGGHQRRSVRPSTRRLARCCVGRPFLRDSAILSSLQQHGSPAYLSDHTM